MAAPGRFSQTKQAERAHLSTKKVRSAFPAIAYVNARLLLKRAGELARPASHAAIKVYVRLLDGAEFAFCVRHDGILDVDCFGRHRAPFQADTAIGSLGPRQAESLVINCRSDYQRRGIFTFLGDPTLLQLRKFLNRSRGTDFGTQHATWFAVADLRRQQRTPQTHQPCLVKREL